MRFRTIFPYIGALAFLVPATDPSFADEGIAFLASLAGDWKGRGIMQTDPASEPEAVICRFKSRLSEDGRRIDNAGSCAGAQAKAKVVGSLAYNPSTRRFTGRMLSAGDGRSSSSGTLAERTLSMKTVVFDDRRNVVARGTVRVTLSESGLSIDSTKTMARTDESFTAVRLALTRR